MANYTNITYSTDYPTRPAIQVNNADVDIIVHKLAVEIDLVGPSEWTPTHYKLWNIDGVSTEGEAAWVAYTTTVTGTIYNIPDLQNVYAKFKDSGNETSTVTSSGVTFEWTDPIIHSSVEWAEGWISRGYEAANSNTLRNTTYNIDVSLNKTDVKNLLFNDADLSDIKVSGDTIGASPTSYLGSLLVDVISSVGVIKTFESADKQPLLTVDPDNLGEFTTVTKYDGSLKDLDSSYTDGVENVAWNVGQKELSWDVKHFSTYGFATIDEVTFTAASTQGGYDGNSIDLKVLVKDTNSDVVELAPVAFSIVSGDTIGNFTSTPVNTDANGIATAQLNLTSTGECTIQAIVDGVSATQFTWSLTYNTDMERSLLRQLEQIRSTATYDDGITDINTQAVAEPASPTASGDVQSVHEHGMNVFRTLLKQLKGTTNWYNEIPNYFNAKETDASNTASGIFSMAGISQYTTMSQTVILAVNDDSAGSGFTTASGSVGFLAPITLRYATPDNRISLPIFASTSNSGIYHDIGADDNACRIDVFDTSNGGQFENTAGHLVYAKYHDGEDHPTGSGTGYDVWIRFYANDVLYTFDENDPTNVSVVYPYRRVMADIEEWEWMRTDFVSSWEGGWELIEDINDLWSFTGALNNLTDPSWDNTGNYYPLSLTDDTLEVSINAINDAIGDRSYEENNYIGDDDPITDSLEELDEAIKDLADYVDSSIGTKLVEEISGGITAGTFHALPESFVYTPTSTEGREGRKLDIFLDGQLLAASTGANGVNEDRDYAETAVSGITFHTDVHQESNVTYVVKG